MGLCFNLGFSGELDEALRINVELVEIAEAGDRRLLPIARLFLCMTETSLGHFSRSLELARDTIGMEIEPGLTPFWSPDIGLRTQIVVCLALLGRVTDFDTEVDSLLRHTEESGYYANRAIPLTYAAAARLWLGQRREAAVLCAQAVALAEEMQDPTYLTLTRILQAYADLSDQPARLIAEIEAQQRARDARGEPWWSSCFRGWLAEAYWRIGDFDAAMAQTDAALALREEVFRSETWRIRAEALQAQGRSDEAEACLQRALTMARAQDAQVFQLRSALALSRLLRRSRRPDGAKETLAAALRECTNARGSKLYIETEIELAS
jgi:tetratricopeptide (TPR) repeat protein